MKIKKIMIPNIYILRKTASVILLLFPALMMLAFIMHFPSVHSFLNFQLTRNVYDGGKLFDTLVGGNGHGFIMAHLVAVLAVPLFFLTIVILGAVLYPKKPKLAIMGVIIGIIGVTAMAAVFGAWLSFTGIAAVNKSDYPGARIAFIELVRMKGMLKLFTVTSNLSFISIIIITLGLVWQKQFETWRMLSVITGALLFILFMYMDNWMFVGSLLLLLGFSPVSKALRNGLAFEKK